MHAKIVFNYSIHRLLQYHDSKVRKGVAELIFAENFLKDKNDLTLKDRLYPFIQRFSLNEQARNRLLHVILQFDPVDNIPKERMINITREYMQAMAWNDDPYLVYRHSDTNQPHLHVVAPKIGRDGNPLVITRKDYYRSKMEIKRIEQRHSLKPSDPATRAAELRQFPLQKIRVGKTPLWLAMNKIVEAVIPGYRFTSLDELNAILRLYNLRASRGTEASVTYKKSGLLYVPLDDEGKDAGAYLTASSLRIRPTLKKLEKLYIQNQPLREPHIRRLTVAIDYAFHNKSLSIRAFRKHLEKAQISSVVKRDANGNPQDIWYVDHVSKTVFEGQTLGPQYGAAAISKRCISENAYQTQQQQQQTQKQQLKPKII